MAEYGDSLRHTGGTAAISNIMPLQQRHPEMTSDKSEDSDSKFNIEDEDDEGGVLLVELLGDDVSGFNNSIKSEVKESEEDESAAESYEGDGGFEFKKRNEDDMQVETEPKLPNASEDVWSKKESEPSNYLPERI